MEKSYIKLRHIGPQELIETDPWPYCIINDRFYSDVSGRFGPFCDECRKLMSLRCSKKWDKACDVYSMNVDPNVPDEILASMGFEPSVQDLPEGKKHLLRTFVTKYCKKYSYPDVDNTTDPTMVQLGKCFYKSSNFNRNVAISPQIGEYEGDCIGTCDAIDISKIDKNDKLFQLIKNDPELMLHLKPKIQSMINNSNDKHTLIEDLGLNKEGSTSIEDLGFSEPVKKPIAVKSAYSSILIYIILVVIILIIVGMVFLKNK
jgi:hypothetical protein